MDPLVTRLSLTHLTRDFGPPTVQRARGLERLVRITERASKDDRFIAMGTVEGTHQYQTMVQLRADASGVRVTGTCSCPVRTQCKHAVAMCLVLMTERGPAVLSTRHPELWVGPAEEWLREFAALEPAAGPASGAAKLALRWELDPTPSRYGGPLGLTLRPLRVGKTGRWVKSGAAWNDIASPWGNSLLDDAQQGSLDAVADALGGPGAAAQERSIEAATPRVWLALQRALEAGVEFLPDGALESIELSGEAASVVVAVDSTPVGVGTGDASTRASATVNPVQASTSRANESASPTPAEGGAGSEGNATLSLGVTWGGQRYSKGEFIPVGRRAHGVLLLLPGALPDAFQGVLARFERPLSEQLSYTLRMGRTISVPESGRRKLVDDVLPRLARHVKVSADEPSYTEGIPEPPVLAAVVKWSGLDAVHVSFALATQRRGQVDLVPLGGPGSAAGRLSAAESAALGDWTPGPHARELLNLDAQGRPPAVGQRFEGAALVRFATELLPELRASLPVHESGEQPALRELSGDPLVSFELGEPQGGVDWLDLSIEVVVDGESVPLPDVLAAFTAGDDVVLLPSGAYVSAAHPVLQRLAHLVEEARSVRRGARSGGGSTVRVGPGDVSLWEEVDRLGVANPAAQRWIETARALQPDAVLPRVEPNGVVTELRDYQRDGLDWLSFLHRHGLGGILADDMGLGKTLQVLALLSAARAGGSAPFLVVAPTSVVSAWQRQAGVHTPGLAVRTVQATRARRKSTLAEEVRGADVLVTSYTLLRAEAAEYGSLEWGGLILDEAQAIKNAASKTFQAVRGLSVPFALAVTGTPVENRLAELWPLLAIVAPGLYPTLESFTRLVVTPVERHQDQEALERMRTRIRPFLLRRTKALVASALPPKQEEVLPVALAKPHRHFYDALLQRERQEVLGLVEDLESNRVAVFASLTRLRLASLHAGLVDPEADDVESAKIAELIPRLTELAQEGHRALVFSQFTSFLGRIRTAVEAAGLDVVYLDGSTRDRAAVLDSFAAGQAPVFLISLKAGGVGLTLTEADYVFIMDPWWNPAVEAQAVDRAHRIGQERPVMVYRLVAQDTIEEKVMELKQRKAALFDAVLEGAQTAPTALGEEELRELLG